MKKNILNNIFFIPFFIYSFCLSCSILKPSENQNEKLKPISYKKLTKNISDNNFKFDWLKLKGNVNISLKGENQSIKGNFRIRNDSVIWTNLSKSSVQILTGLIAKDSVKSLIKYPEKKYFSGNFNELEKIIGVKLSYNLIENILTGNLSSFNNSKKTTVQIKDNLYYFNSENKDQYYNDFTSEYWINPILFKCDSISLSTMEEEKNLNISYNDWLSLNDQYFPMTVKFNFTSINDTIKMQLNFKEPVRRNEKQNFPFKKTGKYTPLILE